MTVIRMSVATVTASLAAEISLCTVIVYNHRLGRRKWRYNRSIKPAPVHAPYTFSQKIQVFDLELSCGNNLTKKHPLFKHSSSVPEQST